MRIRQIILGWLLIASVAMQAASLSTSQRDSSRHPAQAVHHHACCPTGLADPLPRTPEPSPDPHRCCFLRGPLSTLPVRSVWTEKPIVSGFLPTLTSLFAISERFEAAAHESEPIALFLIEKSVELRN